MSFSKLKTSEVDCRQLEYMLSSISITTGSAKIRHTMPHIFKSHISFGNDAFLKNIIQGESSTYIEIGFNQNDAYRSRDVYRRCHALSISTNILTLQVI